MFRIGQKVARFAGKENYAIQYGAPFPKLHEPCTVSNIFEDEDGEIHIELVEYPSPARDEFQAGFRAKFFRPVVERKTDISIFTAMLNPSQVTVDAMNMADHAREMVQ